MIDASQWAGHSRFPVQRPRCCARSKVTRANQRMIGSVDGGGVAMRDLIHHTAGMGVTPSRTQSACGDPARSRLRRAVTGLAITVVSAVAVVSAGCASSSTSSTAQSSAHSSASSPAAAQPASSSSGAIHFPATLFGQGHNTSAGAQQLARQLTRTFAVMPIFTHPQAAVYGASPDSQLFVVLISDLSAAAEKYGRNTSPAALHRAFLMMSISDARTFPAGQGAALGCGHLTASGTTFILCIRYSKKTADMAMYFHGAASGLSDAASKTSQAISASGG